MLNLVLNIDDNMSSLNDCGVQEFSTQHLSIRTMINHNQMNKFKNKYLGTIIVKQNNYYII